MVTTPTKNKTTPPSYDPNKITRAQRELIDQINAILRREEHQVTLQGVGRPGRIHLDHHEGTSSFLDILEEPTNPTRLAEQVISIYRDQGSLPEHCSYIEIV